MGMLSIILWSPLKNPTPGKIDEISQKVLNRDGDKAQMIPKFKQKVVVSFQWIYYSPSKNYKKVEK